MERASERQVIEGNLFTPVCVKTDEFVSSYFNIYTDVSGATTIMQHECEGGRRAKPYAETRLGVRRMKVGDAEGRSRVVVMRS